jgi:acetyl-CoA/propionyl-CoA carboxylase biotin carboxyl carrier protein
VEAMKMENDIKAHKAGTIASVNVGEGQTVEIGDVLITISDD